MEYKPRKHHFVPQFYLAGFTDNGTKEGSLNVLDTVRQGATGYASADACSTKSFGRKAFNELWSETLNM